MLRTWRRGIGTLAGMSLTSLLAILFIAGTGWWVLQNNAALDPANERALRIDIQAAPTARASTTTPVAQAASPAPGIAHGPLPEEPRSASDNALGLEVPRPGEHPLLPLVRWATQRKAVFDGIADYECVFHKRERVDGELLDREVMLLKVRHRPFSVYMRYLAPASMRGQEVLYVDGRNDGKLLVRLTGLKSAVGTRPLDPTGFLAMESNRYPITQAGMERLTQRLIDVGSYESRYPECDVSSRPVRIDGHDCTLIEVLHPVKAPHYLYHRARIYVRNDLQVPVRFEAYDWPRSNDREPPLVEEYTYQKLKLNNGFTDAHFDADNLAQRLD